MDSRAITVLYEFVLVVLLATPGIYAVSAPGRFLAKLGRPVTDKHIRASRLIGGLALFAAVMTLFHLIRGG